MNLDLIIKLAKLANNNPADHEANAAARKVCRLIAEGNYQFNVPTAKPTQQQKPTTWNDVRRSPEPFWRAKPQEPTAPSAQEFWEIMEKLRRAREKQQEAERFRRETQGSWEPPVTPPIWDIPLEWEQKKERASRRMVPCVHCKKEFMTSYVGNFFECWDCWKTEHEKAKGF